MNKRFFYTDPLAAAWMMTHFGTRFANHNNGTEISMENLLRHALTGNICEIHIHPDSLPLLEPQEGDLGVDMNKECFTYWAHGKEWQSIHVGECSGDRMDAAGNISIIRRKSIAFHYPDSEEA